MDEPLVVLGVALPLIVALVGAIWWLVASVQRDRRQEQVAADYARHYRIEPDPPCRRQPAHLFCGQGEAITVAELLDEAADCESRLNWPEEDLDEPVRVRPYAQDQMQTTIFLQVADHGNMDEE